MILPHSILPTETGVEVRVIDSDNRMNFHGIGMEQMIHGFQAYQAGQLIQEAYPFLTAGQREFLMTGMTPEEWDELFGQYDSDEAGADDEAGF